MNKRILIIGGAGFIGSNTAKYFYDKGNSIIIFDNFIRQGSKENIRWLQHYSNDAVTIITGDIRQDFTLLQKSVKEADIIFHFAAQVAVTTSVLNPREDFEINALGTFNVLEAIRLSSSNPILIFSSTNKIYGELQNEEIKELPTRYVLKKYPNGIAEDHCIDFHSPYGCSKGAADQYVRDYSRIYGLRSIVLRQSCIYGPRQFGTADQGWVPWFIIAVMKNKPITIYGNGKQVRDLLYIDDLLTCFDLAISHSKETSGQIYNIGGGVTNSLSVWVEFKPILEALFNKKISVFHAPWRPGDQSIFISDIRKAEKEFGWKPNVSLTNGITQLYQWITTNKSSWPKIG